MVTVRFYAGAAAASGIDEAEVNVPAESRVIDAVREACPHPIEEVLEVSSFLVNGQLVDREQPVGQLSEADETEIHVLPPFAGG